MKTPNSEQRAEAFQRVQEHIFRLIKQLRPYCVAVSNLALSLAPNHNRKELIENLSKLLQILQSIEKSVVDQKLGDYIFFPFSNLLRQRKDLGDRELELVLKCLDCLIGSAWSDNSPQELHRQLFLLITFIIGGSPGKNNSPLKSEDSKIAAVICLRTLFQAINTCTTNQDIKCPFINNDNIRPVVGHCVSSLLDTLVQENFALLQQEICNTISFLVTEIIKDGDILAAFLPGTVSAICKVLQRESSIRHANLICSAVELLYKILAICLSDNYFSDIKTGKSQATHSSDAIGVVNRTEKWFEASKGQIKVALGTIYPLRSHLHSSVRFSYFEMSKTLLQECPKSLGNCFGMFLQTIMQSTLDTDIRLHNESSKFLSSLHIESELGTLVKSSVQQSCYNWVMSMPRILSGQDEPSKQSILNNIIVAVDFIANSALTTSISVELLAQNLKTSLKFLSVHKIQVSHQLTLTERVSLDFPKLELEYINDKDTLNLIEMLVSKLGSSSIGLELSKMYLSDIKYEQSKSVSSLWLLVHLLQAGLSKHINNLEFKSLVLDLYDQSSSFLSEHSGPEQAELATCLHLQSISIASKLLGPDFANELVQVLYLVSQYLPSSATQVRSYSQTALFHLSVNLGYPSIQALLIKNADYLVNSISLRLNCFDITPNVPMVLLGLVKITEQEIIPYLNDVVDSIFALLDGYHGHYNLVTSLLAVLEGIVGQISNVSDLPKLEFRRSLMSSHDQTCNEIKDFAQLLYKMRTEQHIDPESLAETQMPKGVSRSTTVHSTSVVIVQKIVDKSQYFLTHESSNLRYRLLSLISSALPILTTNEKQLLPLINAIWPPIASRLKDSETHVVIEALSTVGRLCLVSKDFMTVRFAESAWPVCKKYLYELRGSVRDKVNPYTREAKLLYAIFEALELALRSTRIEDKLFDQILAAVSEYWHIRLVNHVQQQLDRLVNAMNNVNPDAVWLEENKGSKVVYQTPCKDMCDNIIFV